MTLNVQASLVAGWIVQRVLITAVVGVTAQCSAALGTLGATGGNGTLGFDSDKVYVPAGATALQQGIRFAVPNKAISPQDVVTLNTLQVGSINPGKNATFHLNIKVPANPGA
jgi:hypothetical protein